MDVCESERAFHKHSPADTIRPPLVPAEKNNALNNAVSTRRPRTRDVHSRYKSPTPSSTTASVSRRCPSPSLTRTSPSNVQLAPKRSLSAERKRPSTPPSPSSPTTPVSETSVDKNLSSRRLSVGGIGGGGGGRLPESLWPSTMRSLSVSFQSDAISIPSKKEKPVPNVSLDRTLRPSSNVAHKQAETPTNLSRKPTPERKRSPLKGKHAPDQSENSKPVDGLHTRLIDQHRWPSRIGGKVCSNSLHKSVDLSDKIVRNSVTPVPGVGYSSLRRIPNSDSGLSKPIQKSSSDTVSRLLSLDEIGRVGSQAKSIDESSLRISGPYKHISTTSSDKSTLATPAARSHSLPTAVSRPQSPSRTSGLSSSRGVSPSRTRSSIHSRGVSPSPSVPSRGVSPSSSVPSRGVSPSSSVHSRGVSPSPSVPSRGVSPSPSVPSRGVSPSPSVHARGVSPSPSVPSRGVSPSRTRPSVTTSQSNSSTSVLSFIADVKRGKKSASYIDDAHQLRLLHNRYLQWRFTNARAEAVLYIQKVTAEDTLYNVWNTTLSLWDSVIRKRINLQQLRMELKLKSVLNNQMVYLDDWASFERDHINSLSGVVEDLEASTLRVPLTGGAKADIESLKGAVCSAVDVMQAMGSSICSLLSRAEAMNSVISELAVVAAQEKAMLDECEALLAATTATQVEEYSLRTHLIQMKQVFEKR